MKKVKPKVSTKAPRKSASKSAANKSATVTVKSFESTTQFNDGTLVTIVGFSDGQINIHTKVNGIGESLIMSSTAVAALMRTMAKKMISDGIKLEDFL